MKKTIAFVGLAAVSASALHAQSTTSDLTPTEKAKWWSVSASVRGFYDDNITTLPSGVANPTLHPRTGFGIDVNPSFGLNHSGDATTVSGRYSYDLRHYFTSQGFNDQTHQFDAKLDHSFSERYNLKVSDSFVSAQEPTVIDQAIVATPLRTQGDNIRNTGKIDFTAEMTKLISFQLGYQNSLYMYKQNTSDLALNPATAGGISRSAELDRMEHMITANLLWRPVENTTIRFGYQFGLTEYTSPEIIIGPNVVSGVRNNRAHYFYVGVDQNFTPELTAQVRAGIEVVDYYESPSGLLKGSPYADASLRYGYSEGSYVQAGVRHARNTTDLVGNTGNDPVLDAESTAAYLRGNQKILSRLNLNWMGQYQFSSLDGGGVGFNNRSEDFYIGQLNLSYQINSFVAAETGYEFDYLGSELSRSYKRQQVYVGVRASY